MPRGLAGHHFALLHPRMMWAPLADALGESFFPAGNPVAGCVAFLAQTPINVGDALVMAHPTLGGRVRGPVTGCGTAPASALSYYLRAPDTADLR